VCYIYIHVFDINKYINCGDIFLLGVSTLENVETEIWGLDRVFFSSIFWVLRVIGGLQFGVGFSIKFSNFYFG
jgi:hypothetical protein